MLESASLGDNGPSLRQSRSHDPSASQCEARLGLFLSDQKFDGAARRACWGGSDGTVRRIRAARVGAG